MKTIFLVHQPDSSIENSELHTLGKPMSRKGYKDILTVSQRLKNRDSRPDLIISSQAETAVETAEVIAEELELPRSSVEVRDKLYEPEAEDLINMIRAMDENLGSVMLVGHKATFDDLTGFLSGDNDEHVNEGAIACIEVDVDHWNKVDEHAGIMKYVIDPDDEPPASHSQDLMSTKR